MFGKRNNSRILRFNLIIVFCISLFAGVSNRVHASLASHSRNINPVTIMNLNIPGSLDATFDGDGLVTTSLSDFDEARGIAVQPDGKIVVAAGSFESDLLVIRYNSDGVLDTSFGGDGIVTLDFGTVDVAIALAIQVDGKIVVAGSTYGVSGASDAVFAIARFNPDGSPDANFGASGKIITDAGPGYEFLSNVAIQADGKIVAIGAKNVGIDNDDIILVRYNKDGSLDTSFDGDGIVTTAIGDGSDYLFSMVFQPDGRIVVGGGTQTGSGTDFVLVRYHSNGLLDAQFNSDGIVIADVAGNDNGGHIALQPDGKILIAGYGSGNGSFLIARYDKYGYLDPNFGAGGTVISTSSGSFDRVQDMALQPNNKIVLAGYTVPGSGGGDDDFVVARFNGDGSPDTSFDSDGTVVTDFGVNLDDLGNSVAIQADGKIVVAGRRYTGAPNNFDIAIARYHGDSPVIRYVDLSATGANDGTSWNNAFTDLQSALSIAAAGDQIWVAAGTYRPTTGVNRNVSFVLKNGVSIYGGFAGTETSRVQRDYQGNVTTLSGDIGVLDDASDNSFHVVVGSNTNNTTVLDGFTVSDGNGDSSGGGMYVFTGSPTLRNILFENNYAIVGGGMYNDGDDFPPPPFSTGSNPTLTDVIFRNNSAKEGGGMRNINYSNPILTRVVFEGNTAIRTGGGMQNFNGSSPILTDVTFTNNSALPLGAGGGMFNWIGNNPVMNNVTFSGNSAQWGGGLANYESNPILTNVTFTGNSSSTFGGAISNESYSLPTLVNVTLSGNSASTVGGAIYNDASGSNVVVRNSILFDNVGGEIHNEAGSATVTYSTVEGGYAGTGNLNSDPLLGLLQNNGGFTQTMALRAGSPAIDAGNDTNCPSTDQRRVTRPQGSHCDMGAYEYQPPASTPTATFTPSSTSTATPTATFTPTSTPTSAPTLVPTNLALNKSVSVSSFQDSSHTGNMAVDGNFATYWQSRKATGRNVLPSEWIVVDLGATAALTSVELEWNANYATSYLIRVSNDGANWTTVFSTSAGNGGNDTIQLNAVSSRYVRMQSTVWSDGSLRNWLREFEIFGYYSVQPPTLTPTVTLSPTATSGTLSSVHVGDLDGSSRLTGKNWQASVVIRVHDSNHSPVANAMVDGTWSGGFSGSCVTDATGSCTITSPKFASGTTAVTFTVGNVTYSTIQYLAVENHDPDGDSNGSSIIVQKP